MVFKLRLGKDFHETCSFDFLEIVEARLADTCKEAHRTEEFKDGVVWEDLRLGELGENASDCTALVKKEFSQTDEATLSNIKHSLIIKAAMTLAFGALTLITGAKSHTSRIFRLFISVVLVKYYRFLS